MTNAITDVLTELDSYVKLLDNIKYNGKPNYPGTFLCSGVIDSQKCHLIHALGEHSSHGKLIITHSELKAKEIYEDMRFFNEKNIYLYPAKDAVFYSADVKSAHISKQRFKALEDLLKGEKTSIIVSIEALFDRITPKDIFEKFILELEAGDILSIDSLSKKLVLMGYERRDLVEATGQFAVRGGIMDLYAPTYETALRIEFWGDEIDSIRIMDSYSQRSIEKINAIRILPMRELVYEEDAIPRAIEQLEKDYTEARDKYIEKDLGEITESLEKIVSEVIEKFTEQKSFSGVDKYIQYFYDEGTSLIDYLPKDTLIFFDEPIKIAEHSENILFEFYESMKNRIAKGHMLPRQLNMFFSYHDILSATKRHFQILLSALPYAVKDFNVSETFSFETKSTGIIKNRLDMLTDELEFFKEQNYRMLVLAGTKTRAERLLTEFSEKGFSAQYYDNFDDISFSNRVVALAKGSLEKGFEYPLIRFVIISDKELFGSERERKDARKRKTGTKIENFADLKIGDYVVHDNHGIGVYKGIEKMIINGVSKDYLKIGYANEGNLYVNINQLNLLQKYVGGSDVSPKLNKLGGSEWIKAKNKVRNGVKKIAAELIDLYAKRQNAVGFVYNPDTVWQKEFEDLFIYEETEDQLLAIEDVKRDMESPKVMDRLICGDVGYGKTEVAIRAAFKAVQDNKQVAILVPTTILAQQHYNTFLQRIKGFPITVEMLSRFRSHKQQKEIVAGLAKGSIDIVIGTHRLLSKDIIFNNLGLIVVDEEQRFGVSSKEKLKHIKENVDALTLTATPIPRTLHMSLTGIRDLSLLEEPPQERQPIQTFVMEYDEESVRDAINREISRNGQVYFLHNRVMNIIETAARIQQLMPDVTISYAHGQMSEHELEKIMIDFIEGEIDVLVCTTIIETGLDIPNVNTIIIQDADRMGLAQLYQLRGRVGRSNRTSYAYLMYKKDKALSELSQKRLQTIREFTEFGSGFKIAMRDLEIRGAGNILGGEQHGHMDIVGYDTYCKILSEVINEFKGEPTKEDFETAVTLNVNAFIPSFYIENEEQKLEVYKKISFIKNERDYFDVYEEIEDRFGNLPPSVENLLDAALLKSVAHSVGIISIFQKNKNLIIKFKEGRAPSHDDLSKFVAANIKDISMTISPDLYLTYKIGIDDLRFLRNLTQLLRTIVIDPNLDNKDKKANRKHPGQKVI